MAKIDYLLNCVPKDLGDQFRDEIESARIKAVIEYIDYTADAGISRKTILENAFAAYMRHKIREKIKADETTAMLKAHYDKVKHKEKML